MTSGHTVAKENSDGVAQSRLIKREPDWRNFKNSFLERKNLIIIGTCKRGIGRTSNRSVTQLPSFASMNQRSPLFVFP